MKSVKSYRAMIEDAEAFKPWRQEKKAVSTVPKSEIPLHPAGIREENEAGKLPND
jgi:hypothetical protein